jgi:hypothetical protein
LPAPATTELPRLLGQTFSRRRSSLELSLLALSNGKTPRAEISWQKNFAYNDDGRFNAVKLLNACALARSSFFVADRVLFRALLVSRGVAWFQKFRRRGSNFSEAAPAFLLNVEDASKARAASKEL